MVAQVRPRRDLAVRMASVSCARAVMRSSPMWGWRERRGRVAGGGGRRGWPGWAKVSSGRWCMPSFSMTWREGALPVAVMATISGRWSSVKAW